MKLNPTIQTHIQQRESLIREIKSMTIRISDLERDIKEKTKTSSQLSEDIVAKTAIRDYILTSEIPNVKRIVSTLKGTINV